MREIVHCCRVLKIPTILVPHESVFIDEERYYVARSGANMPATDHVLAWGQMQRRIFLERGYRPDRLLVTGSPKFDIFHRYQPTLDRDAYASIFALDPSLPIVLFAGQPLDSQVDSQDYALDRQSQAIEDLLDVARELGVQVIIRQPPAKRTIIDQKTRLKIETSVDFAIDGPVKFLVSPEEALYHAAAVLSVNSTMLFEAVLMGRPSISMPYFKFEQIWQKLDIARAPDKDTLLRLLAEALAKGKPMVSEQGMGWARRELAAGAFDGAAAARVCAEMTRIAALPRREAMRPGIPEELVEGHTSGAIALLSNDALPARWAAPLRRLFGVKALALPKEMRKAAGADYGMRIDQRFQTVDPYYQSVRRLLGRPELFVDHGFVASGTPKAVASLIYDDRASYYDATRESRLVARLNGEMTLDPAERDRVAALLPRLSVGPAPLRTSARRILVVDQAQNDRAVALGGASVDSFATMLKVALEADPSAEIGVMAPAAIGSLPPAPILTPERIAEIAGARKVTMLAAPERSGLPAGWDVVHVVSADVGLIAALGGAEVVCHGTPFYAGWGFTTDRRAVPFRRRARTAEEVFHVAWIVSSRYFDPRTGEPCALETLLPPAEAGSSAPAAAAARTAVP
ncbi:hypothetical protein [Prosthecomicrobium hirschii]|uniref:capsular polysaccharide export protein, LipB/KpsS family n=1 Tax=Prosthecodimorpha hirschii TaxID=665126 RepID=UPI001364C033|nr:hypothetical protein [Prosthecomicrobium hirschii]